MFADDTNLFYQKVNINNVFLKWFVSNKLSLNVKKQNARFSKPIKKVDFPLTLPKLNINNSEITRTESIKFLGVFLA